MILSRKTLSYLLKIFFALLMFVKAFNVYAQIAGCKDPMANNYNPSATINDGSCTYNFTFYSPPILVDSIDAALAESSGLQMAGNFLWTFNDSGGDPAIYRIDTLSGEILQTVNLSGATNVDWEDIAFDGTFFYVGDFGNNADGARTDLKIYKFPLSAIPDYISNPNVTIPSNQVEVIQFSYSDQPTPIVAAAANNTRFDCEAMIVDGGKIHLFTKNWIELNTVHYVINATTAGVYQALAVDTLATDFLVTGADKVAGQNIITLLGYQISGLGNHFMYLLTDYSNANYFNGNKRRIDLPGAAVMGQAEGITFRNGTYGYLSNEKLEHTVGGLTLTVKQKLRSFNTSSFIPVYLLPLELNYFDVTAINGKDKITWQFYNYVQKVDIEYSIDGINFKVIKTFTNSISNFFYHSPVNAINYYRLVWHNINGDVKFSKVVKIENQNEHTISNFLLKKNGELSFTLNNNAPQLFSFQLVSADGKIISQIKESTFFPGVNKISMSSGYNLSQVIYLNIWNNEQKQTFLLHVEK